MKKLLFYILLFFTYSTIFSANFDSNVKAYYDYEGTCASQIGSYDFTVTGTIPYQTDKYIDGTRSYMASSGNIATFSTAQNNLLKSLSAGTVSIHFYNGSGGDFWNCVFKGAWDSTTGVYFMIGEFGNKKPEFTTQCDFWNESPKISQNAWHFLSIEWTGTQHKIYIDETLVFTKNSTNNPFVCATNTNYLGNPNSALRIDRMIISDIARGGIEAQEIVETPTSTQTITETSTQTITETVTDTITQTVTETITETITPTITQTVTETITETVTPTITSTVTPTFTIVIQRGINSKDGHGGFWNRFRVFWR